MDFPEDTGCESALDDDENNVAGAPECSDGIDNDGDGLTDYPDDVGCGNRYDPVELDPPASSPFSSLCAPLAPGVVEITESVTYGSIDLNNPQENTRYVVAVPYSIAEVDRLVESDYGLWETRFPARDQFDNAIYFDDSLPFFKLSQIASYQEQRRIGAQCYEVFISEFPRHAPNFLDVDAEWVGDISNHNFPTNRADFKLTLDIEPYFFTACGINGIDGDEISQSEIHSDCLCVDDQCVLPIDRVACSDGSDNDSDGLIDYPSDPNCESIRDNDEAL
jgi:hypothetical protein